MSSLLHSEVLMSFRFLNEGVSSIVFQYSGANEELRGWVLRVPKFPQLGLGPEHELRKRMITIFQELLGHEYVLEERLVALSGTNVLQLVKLARPQRLAFRFELFGEHTVNNNVEEWPAWLLPDLTFLSLKRNSLCSSFSIELKPKWAFMAKSRCGSPAVLSQVCRFCRHQVLKSSKSGAALSKYCPLDLFAGEHNRHRKAIEALMKTPQNNLRIFYEGAVVPLSKICRILPFAHEPEEMFAELLSELLWLCRPLLARLQQAQQISNIPMVEAHALFQDLSPEDRAAFESDPLPRSLISKIVQRSHSQFSTNLISYECKRTLAQASAAEASPTTNEVLVDFSAEAPLDQLRLLLLAMTARDVSLMITVSPVHSSSEVVHCSAGPRTRLMQLRDGSRFAFRIGVIDLENKNPARMQYWVDTERKIDAAFLQQ